MIITNKKKIIQYIEREKMRTIGNERKMGTMITI